MLKIVKIDRQYCLYNFVDNELSTKVNFGISETEFKSNCNNHTMSFRNRTHKNDYEL